MKKYRSVKTYANGGKPPVTITASDDYIKRRDELMSQKAQAYLKSNPSIKKFIPEVERKVMQDEVREMLTKEGTRQVGMTPKKYEVGGMIGGKRKPPRLTAGERRQGKAEYKSITSAPKSGDGDYDEFVAARAKMRDELAGKAKMRGNSEKMVSKTAKYCGPEGCSSNPTMSGDGANQPMTRGTQKTVRGGRSFQESGSGTLRSNIRQQRKEDMNALAAGARSNASEFEIQRAEKVKQRLTTQAAKREEMNQRAYTKSKPASATTLGYKDGGKLPVKGMAVFIQKPSAGEVKKGLPIGQYQARVIKDFKDMMAYNNSSADETAERYYGFYEDQMNKAKALDAGSKEVQRKIQAQKTNVFEDNLLEDLPENLLKRRAKSIAKKVVKYKSK